MQRLTDTLLRPTWAEVDLDAIRHNVRHIIGLTDASVRLYAALKGDAYGHGCVEVARAVIESGAHGLALANLYECVQIRESGLTAPILLYAGTPASLADVIIRNNITPTITDLEYARSFSERAPDGYPVFVKVDCGLERAGIYAEEARPIIEAITHLPPLRVEGVYTHMHSGSGSDAYAHWQFSRFSALIEELERAGIDIPVKLAASSPFVATHPEMHLNAIDPGHLIYGIPLGKGSAQESVLRTALRALKSRIVQIRTATARERFAEEAPFEATNGQRFAVLPIGWGDGLHRAYGNGGPVLVRGKRTSVLGPVHYEHCRVDLTAIPEAETGDEVVFLGRQGQAEIRTDEIARLCDILPAQVAGPLSKHLPVVYYSRDKPCAMTRPTRESAGQPL